MTIYKVYQFIEEDEYWTKYFVNYDKALSYKQELIAEANFAVAIANTFAKEVKTQEYSEKMKDIIASVKLIEIKAEE